MVSYINKNLCTNCLPILQEATDLYPRESVLNLEAIGFKRLENTQPNAFYFAYKRLDKDFYCHECADSMKFCSSNHESSNPTFYLFEVKCTDCFKNIFACINYSKIKNRAYVQEKGFWIWKPLEKFVEAEKALFKLAGAVLNNG